MNLTRAVIHNGTVHMGLSDTADLHPTGTGSQPRGSAPLTVALPPGSPLAAFRGPVTVGTRPSAFTPGRVPGWAQFTLTPTSVVDLGGDRYAVVDLDAPAPGTGTGNTNGTAGPDPADADGDDFEARLYLATGATDRWFAVRLPAGAAVAPGAPYTVSLPPEQLNVFGWNEGGRRVPPTSP